MRGVVLIATSIVVSVGFARAQPAGTAPAEAQPPPQPPPQPQPQPPAPPPPPPPPAQPVQPPAPAPVVEPPSISALQIHGFVSEGGFVSTANDYIGRSERGSLELFEAGLNVSTDIADRLRAGIQLFGRDVGQFRDIPPRIDWAYLDYHAHSWLGLRAGVIKMPFGLSNEFADIDSARTAILMPQAVYPLRDRSALLSQTGFALYGDQPLGRSAGSLEYQAWLGTLDIPANALELEGATLDDVDTRYITGGQLFWHPPLDGLRVGATYLRTSIDFHLTLSDANVQALIMAGLVPPTFDGQLVISQRPDTLWIASAEYTHEDWLFAAEYGRWYKHQQSTLPALLPTFDEDNERFYALASHHLPHGLELGAYYSVLYLDADDRHGRNAMKFPKRYLAWQRDAAATLRYDVNEHWLWKLEAHFIDGTADLFATDNPDPTRFWGLFLFKTTVTF